MKTKYRDRLITIAQKELPEVLYDVNQATAVMPLQQCSRKLAHMLQLLLHDHLILLSILDNQETKTDAPPPAPVPTPSAAPVLTPQAVPPLALEASLPPVDADPVSTASNSVVPIPGMPPVDIDPNVLNVVVTPLGPKIVAAPSAPAAAPGAGELPDIPAAG